MSSVTPAVRDAADEPTVSVEVLTERDRPAAADDGDSTRSVEGPAGARVPAPGSRVGRYLVTGVLGRGGMGVVVKARDPHLGREVAIKVLRATGGVGSAADARLLREAQALAQLSHPNVVAVHDVGVHEGAVFLAMELVPGLALEARGDRDQSQRVLEQALAQAAAAADDAAMARSWLGLMAVTSRWQARHRDAAAMRPMAEALITRSGTPTPLRLQLLRQLVAIHNELGDYRQSRALLDEELALVRASHGERDPRYAEVLRALGRTLVYQGDYAAGRAHFERARDLLVATLGPQHPAVATALNDLGTCISYQGDFGTALDVYRQVLAIREATVGREHGLTVHALHNVGSSLFDLERYPEARAALGEALAIGERVFGTDHLELSWMLRDLGGTAANSGDPVTGTRYLERALAIRERALGPDHPEVAWVLDMLGQVACEASQYRRGIRHLERARSIFARGVSARHERVAAATAGIAHCQRQAGDDRAAIVSYEQALASLQADTGAAIGDGRLASYRFGLVQALWDTGQRPRALAMAREVRAVLERDAGQKLLQAEVVAWLATRGR